MAHQLMLGDSLDTERITARYDQGVLTITIPVAGTIQGTQGADRTRRRTRSHRREFSGGLRLVGTGTRMDLSREDRIDACAKKGRSSRTR